MKLLELSKIKDCVVSKHTSGLNMLFYPGITNKIGIYLGVNIGALTDNHWVPGMAHFVEHYIWDNENCNDTLFSETGGMANAYTDEKKTIFYVQCYNHVERNLEILLKTVFQPVFNKQKVEKNRRLILKELNMYDNIEIEIHNKCYKNISNEINAFGTDIIGTVNSIENITYDKIIEFYEKFYQPANMYLVIIGNYNKFCVSEKLDEYLPNCKIPVAISDNTWWTKILIKSLVKIDMTKHIESNKSFQFSFYIKLKDKNKLYFKIVFEFLINYMLGNGSELYFRIQEEQNLSFLNYETIVIGDYIIGNIYGKTIDNSIILLELFHKVNEMEQYISKDLFIKCQKSIAAYYLSGLENTVQMIDTLLACFNSNITLKDFFKLIEKVSDTELKNVCREVIKNKNYIIDVWED